MKSGIRLYVALAAGLLTLQAWWWASRVYAGNSELIAARLHEAFGWLSLAWLAVALAIGPAYRLIPRLPGAKPLREARRLLGIGAAWFALLHAAIAYGVSFKAVNPLQLTDLYQRGFAIGAVALLILLALAVTSFDGAMRSLGIWWFRLHRLIYAGALLAVWHALMIGVHAPALPALAILIITGCILFITHMQVALQQEKPVSIWQIATLCAAGILIIALSNYGIQLYVDQNSLTGHGHR